jgi:hypothetical protein
MARECVFCRRDVTGVAGQELKKSRRDRLKMKTASGI